MNSYQKCRCCVALQSAVRKSHSAQLFLILVSGLLILTSPFAPAILDNNQNGASDIWEEQYNSGALMENLDLQADSDGDGWTNAKEAVAGTNPFRANPPDGFVQISLVHTPAVLGPPDGNGVPTIVTPEAVLLSWPTIHGKQYRLLYSSDLGAGSWQLLDEFPDPGEEVEYGIPLTQPDGSTPDKLFWRVAISDLDTDGDGLTNTEEWMLNLDPDQAQTLPGVPDLWLAQYFQASLSAGGPSSIDLNADPDGDGISTLEELQGGTNPNLADGPGSRKWITVTGDGDQDEKVTRTGTLTIPAGQSAILIIATASAEYPVYTGKPSEFNDLLEWNVQTSQGDSFVKTIDVNDRDAAWDIDLQNGTSLPGLLGPAHFEKIQTLTAPDDQDLTIQVTVDATNIEDAAYPSQVAVGIVTMDLAVDANRDDEITFDGQDKTTADKPFRFWINNDEDNVENDEPIIVTTPDFLSNTIKTKRDLEDFCRLKVQIGLPNEVLRSGNYKIGLKFRGASGAIPSILVFANQSPDGNSDYLTDDNAATAQIALGFSHGDLEHCSLIPQSYWEGHQDSIANLIFEGVSTGTGELVVVIHDKNGHELAESAGTWIKLLDVRKMYQRARIVNEPEQIPDPWVNDNPPAQTWVWDPWNWPYDADPDAEPVTAVFVHGWRLTYMDFMNWSDTSYKRLWHQGFKGKFYSFRWPTFSGDNNGLPYGLDEGLEPTIFPPGGLTYNASEYRAWLCGSALADFVNQLPDTPSKRNLFAHSMGNVITGAALRNGMNIKNYALCNAAVAAMAYDANPALKNDANGNPLNDIFFGLAPHKTPDTDPDSTIRQTYGLQGKFNAPNLPHKPKMFSFILPGDSALDSWKLNNYLFKSDQTGHSYYYQETPQPPNLTYKLLQVLPGANPREVTSQAEAMGFVTKSLTRTAGADLRTVGSIGSFQNMSSWGLGANHAGFNTTHSAPWRWNNQSTHLFWQKLTEELELIPQP